MNLNITSREVVGRDAFDAIGPTAANPCFSDLDVLLESGRCIQEAQRAHGHKGKEAVIRSALARMIVEKRRRLRAR